MIFIYLLRILLCLIVKIIFSLFDLFKHFYSLNIFILAALSPKVNVQAVSLVFMNWIQIFLFMYIASDCLLNIGHCKQLATATLDFVTSP